MMHRKIEIMSASQGQEVWEQREFKFTTKDFDRVRELIYQRAGISLGAGKQEMVYSRLARRLRTLELGSFGDYLSMLESSRSTSEWESFTNALTTNLTSFFRESHHFPILADHVRSKNEPLRIWCSASSTGEEPYSIAMTVCETFNTMSPPVHILATDIDTNVLATAAAGVYPIDRVDRLGQPRLQRFFQKGSKSNAGMVRVRPELRKLVTFEQLNLLDSDWQIKPAFDAIFCRNVMIYFDKPTQGKILDRFAPLLKSDGLLFAGHSENFLYVTKAFRLRAKTVYNLARPQGS